MLTFSLQSGSNGNSIYVETPDARLLFDAGLSGRRAAERMARHGRDLRDCDALIVSHDHSDHVRSAGVFSRLFDLPVLISRATLESSRTPLGRLSSVEHFRPGQRLQFGRTVVETVPTPHDGADGSAFVVCHGAIRLGILTDLGHVFDGLGDLVGGLDAAYLEANYDPEMLDEGDYPDWLKRRIAGPGGHLSNVEAGGLASEFGRRLRWLALAHLSEDNNDPGLAQQTVGRIIGRALPLMLAGRYDVSDCWEI